LSENKIAGSKKVKCNLRPGELTADLTSAALDAAESDCSIIRSGAAWAIKMQSKSRLTHHGWKLPVVTGPHLPFQSLPLSVTPCPVPACSHDLFSLQIVAARRIVLVGIFWKYDD
jgi:hypothetical protein